MAKDVKAFSESKPARRRSTTYLRRDAKFWQELIATWRGSGKSVNAFCRAQGVASSTFMKWRRSLEDSGRATEASELQIVDFLSVPIRDGRAVTEPGGTTPDLAQPSTWEEGPFGAKTAASSAIELILPGLRMKLTGAHADRLMRILATRLTRSGF